MDYNKLYLVHFLYNLNMKFNKLLFTLGATSAVAAIPAAVVSCGSNDSTIDEFNWDHHFTNAFLLDENKEINNIGDTIIFDAPGLFAASLLGSSNNRSEFQNLSHEIARKIIGSLKAVDHHKDFLEGELASNTIDFNFKFNFAHEYQLEISAETDLSVVITNLLSTTGSSSEFVLESPIIGNSFEAKLSSTNPEAVDRTALETADRQFIDNLDSNEKELIEKSTQRLMTMIIDNAFSYVGDLGAGTGQWFLMDKSVIEEDQLITSLFSESQIRKYWYNEGRGRIIDGNEGAMPFPVSFWNKTGYNGEGDSFTAHLKEQNDFAPNQESEVLEAINYMLFSVFNMDQRKVISPSAAALIKTESDSQRTYTPEDGENVVDDFEWGKYLIGDVDDDGNKPDVENRPFFAFASKGFHAPAGREIIESVYKYFEMIELNALTLRYDDADDYVGLKAIYNFDQLNYDDEALTLSQEIALEAKYNVAALGHSLNYKLIGVFEEAGAGADGKFGSALKASDIDQIDGTSRLTMREFVEDLELIGVEYETIPAENEDDEDREGFEDKLQNALVNNSNGWYNGEAYSSSNKLYDVLGFDFVIDEENNNNIIIENDEFRVNLVCTHILDPSVEIKYELTIELS